MKNKTFKWNVGDVISVEMADSSNPNKTIQVPDRITSFQKHGIYTKHCRLVHYDQVHSATEVDIKTIIKEEKQSNEMIQAGIDLMHNLVEPEFI